MADKHPIKVRVVLISTVDSSINAEGGNGARIRAPSAPRPAVNVVTRPLSVDYGRLRQPLRTPRRMVVLHGDLFPPRRAFGKRRTKRPPWGAPAASSPFVSHSEARVLEMLGVPAPPCPGSFPRVFRRGKYVPVPPRANQPGTCGFAYSRTGRPKTRTRLFPSQ